ncbi:MAG: MobH family relaxase [Burkholderiaceae bacterium]|nr:MobH family relaxase [Burkholderiaceae bacterium]
MASLSDLSELLAGIGLIGGAAAYLFWPRRQKPVVTSDSGISAGSPTRKIISNRPKNHLPILSSDDLFARTGTQGLVETIRTRMGLSPENFKTDVLPVLRQFAEYVQLIPASESHHHAQPGGLLLHTFEVAANALAIRQGYKLPTGAAPEAQIRQAPVWSFGVLIAALLHDVGKPVADVLVDFYGDNTQQSCGSWNGLVGKMQAQAVAKQAGFYTVKFPLTKDYEAHQRLPVTLLHAIITPQAMQWLGGDSRLLQELLAYLDNNDKVPTVLKEIIVKADSLSVSDNLKNGVRIRFASARNPPLIERLMQGLRTLLSESHLAINRPGAPVFVDPDGEHLWIVAGTAADQVRKLLENREERSKGAAGIPTDNTRIFDTWAEYGSLITPSKEFGKGSVWWVKFQIGEWSHVLTVLKFRVDTLFLPGTQTPALLQGVVTPVSPTSSRAETRSDAPAETTGELIAPEANIDAMYVSSAPAAPDADSTGQLNQFPADDAGLNYLLVNYDTQGNALSEPVVDPAQAIQVSQPAIPATTKPARQDVQARSTKPLEPEFLDEPDSVAAIKGAGLSVPKTVQAFTSPKAAPRALFKAPGTQTRENADKFMKWIQAGLGDGSLTYNESDAVIHFVPEGMALITPKVFKMYLESNEFIGSLGNSPAALQALQKEVQKGGYITRNASNKSSFYMYRVRQSDGTMSGFRLTTYVVPNPQAYIRPVPSPNTLLISADEVSK